MKKNILMFVAGLLICSILSAQNNKTHEVSVWGAGGLSTLQYDLNIGDSKNGVGGTVGFGYNYNFNENWSIGSGLELSFYSAKSTIDGLSDSYAANDGEYDFVFHTTIKNYKEKQSATYLNIPIICQYQTPVFNEHSLYVSAGMKIGVPVSKTSKVTNADFNNYGYYPEWENPIQDDPYFMGFGAFKSIDKKGTLDLKIVYILALETGLKWKLSEDLGLYTGVYLDYGLNDIKKADDKRLIQYNKEMPEDYIHNSILLSKAAINDSEDKILSKKINSIAAGIKVRLAFCL
ncbi:porin family protein [Dysgonomonas sp. Marseille-P4361]|uniref:porin family protein n=1 Tax=Dysgonomonas sp. Marseille-P4361 TaxID=2161820 RepID=UPI000D561985|nr:porin family protein [Dysgonomonas sp. Marseille-P4361]